MFLWIDLETTGLNPENDEIVEVGWFFSDNWEWFSVPQSCVVTPTTAGWELLQQQPVNKMHQESGLLAELSKGDTLLIEDVEDQILEDMERLVRKYDVDDIILAGSSVHFDRGFIANEMLRLDERLSHRHFDVSTLRMFFDGLGYHELSERDTPSTHRAKQDIVDSYKLARQYVEWVNKHAEC